MQFTRLKLENWRNFLAVDVALARRIFLVGPNASGKSNLLDAFRFLRDIADPKRGFQWAVNEPPRRGVSQIRSLHARRYPNVAVEVEVSVSVSVDVERRDGFGQPRQGIEPGGGQAVGGQVVADGRGVSHGLHPSARGWRVPDRRR